MTSAVLYQTSWHANLELVIMLIRNRPVSGESMTINIWKSCMWNADEEMNKEAIFTVMKTA